MHRLLPLLLLLACDGGEVVPDDPIPDPDPVVPDTFDAADAVRISMALRGHRPSLDELATVEADPDALPGLVDAWLDSDAFGQTVRHLHADTFLTRTPLMNLPALGPLQGEDRMAIQRALTEEPLVLAERIVLDDRPYTDLVTAATTYTDPIGSQIFDGLRRPAGDGWVETGFTDGRPAAGVLSTNALWMRHVSNGQNFHRARANTISDALLCTDFLTRDIPITGEVDLSDTEAVADALTTQAECVACHQSLDPLASHLWPLRDRLAPFQIIQGYQTDCARPGSCYPVPMYIPQRAPLWRRAGMRPPGYFGLDSTDLGTLGQQIADDPRFAQCAVRRFAGYLTQTAPADVPLQTLAPLQERFVDSGFDAKDLVRAIVLDPAFLDDDADLLTARPLQLAATVEDLTGFRWVVNIDNERCLRGGNNCTGDIDVVLDDLIGFRAMAGGIDGYRVTRPTHTTTPTKALFLAALAEEAANHVVTTDLTEPDRTARRLLDRVDLDTTDEATVRDQLAALHQRLYGEAVAADDPQVDEAWTLFAAALARRGTDARGVHGAWTLTLTGLLQDPRILTY